MWFGNGASLFCLNLTLLQRQSASNSLRNKENFLSKEKKGIRSQSFASGDSDNVLAIQILQ